MKCSSHSWRRRSRRRSGRGGRGSRGWSARRRATSATRPSRNTDASTPRCSSVRATTKPSPPLLPRPHSTPTCCSSEIVERRLHRRHHLAAGVLHQHERRNADVVDRAAIGLAHLLRVQHAHSRSSVPLVLDCRQRRHSSIAAAMVHANFDVRPCDRGAVYVNGRIARAGARRHSGLRSRVPLRRRRLRDAAHLQPRSRFSSTATCAGCAQSAQHLALDVPFERCGACSRWIGDTMAAAGEMRRGLHPRAGHARRRRAHLRPRRHARRRRSSSSSSRSTKSPARVLRATASRSRSSTILRNHPGSVNPIIKSNNLLNNALAMQEANRRGGDEALMRNYRGELSECSQANLFMVRDGAALTPPVEAGLLDGHHPRVPVRGRARRRRRGSRRRRSSRPISRPPTKRSSPARPAS